MQGGQTGPRSFGQVLDGAFSIYTRRFLPLARIAALVWIPLIVALILIDLYRFADLPGVGNDNYFVGDTIRALDTTRIVVGSGLLAILYLIGFLLVVGASLRAASQAYLGEAVEVGASIRSAARRIVSMLWVVLLLAIFIGIPAALFIFILPGVLAIYLTIIWILALPALLLEDRRGFKALGRSNGLVKDYWWRTLGIVIVIAIFTSIIGGLIPALIGDAFQGISADNFTLWVVLTDIVSGIGFIITAPLWAATITAMYYDLRVRKEGFDVEMMVRQLAEPGSEGLPSSSEPLGPGSGASGPPPPAPAA